MDLPLKDQGSIFYVFKDFKYLVENQIGEKIKTMRTRNGGEYNSNEFKDFFR